MTDSRLRLILWGLSAALLMTLALLCSTALTGAGNGAATRQVGGLVAAISLLLSFGCLTFALRGLIRSVLTAFGTRLREQSEEFNSELDRRHAELLNRLELSEEESRAAQRAMETGALEVKKSLEALTESESESTKALGSLARSHRLQTDQVAIIRKQTRACLEGLSSLVAQTSGSSERMPSAQGPVQANSRIEDERASQLASELRKLSAQLEDVKAGQRRTLNYLRREGNVQVVLDRVQASERRLLSSFESGALTLTNELGGISTSGPGSYWGEV